MAQSGAVLFCSIGPPTCCSGDVHLFIGADGSGGGKGGRCPVAISGVYRVKLQHAIFQLVQRLIRHACRYPVPDRAANLWPPRPQVLHRDRVLFNVHSG